MPKVMIGMSGGVDSSVAAFLLKEQGYDCVGVTMKLYAGENADSTCCGLDDVEDAKSVCRKMGIPHYTFNFQDAFARDVIKPFAAEYEAGRTPNPCIACNRFLKFGALWRRAWELGCDYVATGHYVRICREGDQFFLRTAADRAKDQSYVLYFLSREQLSHALFPLGDLTKPQVREIAARQGFLNAKKHDSQDICFVPDGDYGAFLASWRGKDYAPGNFIDRDGNVLGRHRGAPCYTLGQRKGLGVPAATRLYVTGKDMASNTVTLGSNEELFSSTLSAGDLRFTGEVPEAGALVQAKVRYSQQPQPCRVYPAGEKLRVEFLEPQRAITPGQAVVLYDGDTVLGGGTIE